MDKAITTKPGRISGGKDKEGLVTGFENQPPVRHPRYPILPWQNVGRWLCVASFRSALPLSDIWINSNSLKYDCPVFLSLPRQLSHNLSTVGLCPENCSINFGSRLFTNIPVLQTTKIKMGAKAPIVIISPPGWNSTASHQLAHLGFAVGDRPP